MSYSGAMKGKLHGVNCGAGNKTYLRVEDEDGVKHKITVDIKDIAQWSSMIGTDIGFERHHLCDTILLPEEESDIKRRTEETAPKIPKIRKDSAAYDTRGYSADATRGASSSKSECR